MANPDFSSATGWTLTGAVSITGGEAVFTAAAVGDNVKQLVLTIGKSYLITYTIKTLTSGNFRVYAGSAGPGTIRNAPGTYSEVLVCALSNEAMLQARTAGTTATIDDFSVREVI